MSRITIALSKIIGVTKDSREKSVLSGCKGTQGIALKPIVSFNPPLRASNITRERFGTFFEYYCLISDLDIAQTFISGR